MSGSAWTAALIYAITFAIAVCITAAATPLIVKLARHLGVLDTNNEERRVHEVPTPRIGGRLPAVLEHRPLHWVYGDEFKRTSYAVCGCLFRVRRVVLLR